MRAPASQTKDLKRAPKTKKVDESADGPLFQDMEPKVRQQIKIVGRTIFCFRCEGAKEVAGYYCACGSFLCALHLAEHNCLVSASLQYNEELIEALA